mmetsp:Transcript_5131/g.17899  ORF Transcript_5131/g.17899 Transcript_5131/m.17899 type:complete len:554 (+) Transcript_5131:623-2284(+)
MSVVVVRASSSPPRRLLRLLLIRRGCRCVGGGGFEGVREAGGDPFEELPPRVFSGGAEREELGADVGLEELFDIALEELGAALRLLLEVLLEEAEEVFRRRLVLEVVREDVSPLEDGAAADGFGGGEADELDVAPQVRRVLRLEQLHLLLRLAQRLRLELARAAVVDEAVVVEEVAVERGAARLLLAVLLLALPRVVAIARVEIRVRLPLLEADPAKLEAALAARHVVAAAVLLDGGVAPRAVLRVGGEPVERLRVVVALLEPLFHALARRRGVRLVLAERAKGVASGAAQKLRIHPLGGDAQAAPRGRAPHHLVAVLHVRLAEPPRKLGAHRRRRERAHHVLRHAQLALRVGARDERDALLHLALEVLRPALVAIAMATPERRPRLLAALAADGALERARLRQLHAPAFPELRGRQARLATHPLRILKPPPEELLLVPLEVPQQQRRQRARKLSQLAHLANLRLDARRQALLVQANHVRRRLPDATLPVVQPRARGSTPRSLIRAAPNRVASTVILRPPQPAVALVLRATPVRLLREPIVRLRTLLRLHRRG